MNQSNNSAPDTINNMISTVTNSPSNSTEHNRSLYCSNGDAETELLEDLIDAMQIASSKGITDHQMSAIISQAACQIGVNLLSPTILDKELDSNDVITCLKSFAGFLRKAN